jgi:hypothetical protein
VPATASLPGIRFPDRAERLSGGKFEEYKVFVDFWRPLTEALTESFRALFVRGEASIIGIHAPQGAGKTMFATQLLNDFEATVEGLKKGFQPDSENLWHRVSSGGQMDMPTITAVTGEVDLTVVKNDEKWASTLVSDVTTREKPTIALADNAENVYFVRGLVDVPAADLIALRKSGDVADPAAEELVRLARNELAGTLLILLTNKPDFLDQIASEVEARHEGLMKVLPLPLPDADEKEKAVRVNTNRLNKVSYWSCLDRAGPNEKEAVRERLLDATTFPRAFSAVDRAIKSAPRTRPGRPAKRNLLSLVVLTSDSSASIDLPGAVVVDDEVSHEWCASKLFDRGWAPRSIGDQEASLLESEWLLRVVVLGEPFVAALLASGSSTEFADAVKGLIEAFQVTLGGTSSLDERDAFRAAIIERVDGWPESQETDLADFWRRGQNRSQLYEPALKNLFPTYDTGGRGFLDYRPDLVIADFVPCSISKATARTAIPNAIQRNAHVQEFTSTRVASAEAVLGYLDPKLLNYVRITRDQ